MTTAITRSIASGRSVRATCSSGLLLLIILAATDSACAQDATWKLSPNSGTLSEDNNWDGDNKPGGTSTGFFGASNITSLTHGMSPIAFGGLTLTSGAGAYTLANTGALGFTGTGITIDAGSLTITNDGDIGFYSSSSAGSAIFINNSTRWLAFTQSSNAGDATITNNGRLTFSNFASGGTAQVTNNAGGWIDFSAGVGPAGDNINKIGSINGAGDIYVGAYQLTIGGSNRNSDISGIISECGSGSCMAPPPPGVYGSLAKTGTGTLILSGNNTYGGGTILEGGTLSVSSESNLGAIGGGLTFNGGILQITGTTFGSTARTITWDTRGGGFDIADASHTFNLNQALNGTGGLIKRGAGTLVIDNNQSYDGVTDVQAGTLQVGSSGTLAFMSRHNIAAGATLNLNGSPIQIIGSLTGAGNVTNTGPDPTLLMIGFDDTAATFAGNIKDGAPGTIQLQIMNWGTVTTFTGTNTYSGGTSICACSTLQLGDGGTTGSITGNVENGGTLIFNRSNSYTFAGVISDYAGDAGKLIQAGTGNTILTGLNTYRGQTLVNAGTLSVNGSIASSSLTTVNAGGTLGGTGTVGNTLIAGGALAPGNSIGTLNVAGNLVFNTAGRYMIEVDPAGSDRTNVTGTATLSGATVNASFAPGSYITRQYTILNAAGGVIGTFGNQVNTNLPSNFTSKLSYDAKNAYLNLTLSYVPPTPPGPTPPGPTPPDPTPPAPTPGPTFTPLDINQTNVAHALEGYFARNGGIPLVFGALTPTGLSQVSGETGVGLQQTSLQAMNLFLGLIADPTIAGRTGFAPVPGASAFAADALAYAPRSATARDAFGLMTKAVPRAPAFDPRWNVWTAGFGGSQTTDGNTPLGSNTTTSRIYGFAVGADYLWAPQTVAGFAMSGGGTTFSVANAGTGSSDLFQAGAYLRHSTGSAYLSAAAAYGWQDVTTDRSVTAASFDRLRGRFHANAFSGRVELGNRFIEPRLNGIGVTPYAALQITALDLPAYAERLVAGAGNFALSYAAKTVTAPRTELGLRSDKSFALDGAWLTLRGRAAWAHDTNANRSVQATFQSLPGASFSVNGAVAARNAALTSASAELAWTNGLSLAATFESEFSETTRSYAGKGVVRYTW